MKVFVTGATGFIGSMVSNLLMEGGHEVMGLARSDASASALRAKGVIVHRGDIEDLESLRDGARAADGIVHTAFNHDFSTYVQNTLNDQAIVEAIAQAIEGSGKPFVATSGTIIGLSGQLAREEDTADPSDAPRVRSEAGLAYADRGLRPSVVRLPPTVHGAHDTAFVPSLITLARETGVAAFVGDGSNRWPAVHRRDAARLFCLALEHAEPGTRLHGVAEQGIMMRAIAETIAKGLDVPTRSVSPEEAEAHFGWLARFVQSDVPASSHKTRALMGWQPTEEGLLEDMRRHYF